MNNTAPIRFLSILSIGFLTFLGACLSQNSVSAYTFKHSIDTKVEVQGASEVKVTQTHNLEWNNPSYFFPSSKNYLYAYVFPAFKEQESDLVSKVRNITVYSGFGGKDKLTYTTQMIDGSLQIQVPYYEPLKSDNDLEFVISFVTDLYVLKQGGLLELTFPGLSSDFKAKVPSKSGDYDTLTNYSLTLIVPESYGEISSLFPAASSKKVVKAKNNIVYNAAQLVGNSVHVTVGNQRLVHFALTGKTYATNTDTPDFVKKLLVNYIEVVLPSSNAGTESSSQQVYYSKIEPFPTEIKTDADGNLLAKIPVSATTDGQIVIEGYAVLTAKPISDQTKLAAMSEIPATLSNYLGTEPRYWQVEDELIQQEAQKAAASTLVEYERVRKTLTFVSQNLTYAKVDNEVDLRRLGAVAALKGKVGVCMEYSDLLLTLLRAQGIPTRTVFGDGVGPRIDRTLKGIGHQWVGVWFPNDGWVPVDPTWSDNGKEYIGHDFDHFVWYVASKSVNEPSGFNCLSWDSQSPCKDALQIDTTPVDVLPEVGTLLTLQDIQEKVRTTAPSSQPILNEIQKGVSYLGESKVGRVLLSKNGLMVLFALSMYSLLVSIIAAITKLVRNRRGTVIVP